MEEEVVINANSTIPKVLKERIQLHPERLAQIDGKDRMTFGDFGAQVDKLASGLMDLGIKPGEKVALVLPSRNTYPVAMYAVIQMGGVSVGINPMLRPNEFKHIFSDSESVAVIVADQIHGVDPLSSIREIQADLPYLRHVIVDGEAKDTEISLQELIEKSEVKNEYHIADPNELAALIYTSGTTGLPKGSMHSHYTMLYPLIYDNLDPPTPIQLLKIIFRYGMGYFMRLAKSSGKPVRMYASTPPYTGGGAIMVINSFMRGRVFVHLERFIPTEVLSLIEKEKVNILLLTPAFGTMLVRSPELDKYDLSSLIYISMGASTVPPSLVDEIMERIGCPVMIGFGATEVIGGPTRTNPFADPPDMLRETVGKVVTGYEVRIVDEDHQTLPPGEVGEMAVRGGVKMLGYYKADELTKRAFDEDGWYYTGDLATLDDAGYYRIVGRLKDMIIRGGQNIYPAELESVLVTHPKIRQAAVVGIPDALAGEKVLAYIILDSDAKLTPVEVLNFCRDKMAPYKVPANVFFVDDFPLNSAGKVLKRVLREEAVKGG
jgi:fatty-acyl-CoA synthase/long-chain acyl-CoA synthetase